MNQDTKNQTYATSQRKSISQQFSNFSQSLYGSVSKSKTRSLTQSLSRAVSQDISYSLYELNQSRNIKDIFKTSAINEFVFCAKIKKVGKNYIKLGSLYKMEFTLDKGIVFQKISRKSKMTEDQSFEFCHFLKQYIYNIKKNQKIDKYLVFVGTYLKDIQLIVNTHHFKENDTITINTKNSYRKSVDEINVVDSIEWNYKLENIPYISYKMQMVKFQFQRTKFYSMIHCC